MAERRPRGDGLTCGTNIHEACCIFIAYFVASVTCLVAYSKSTLPYRCRTG